MHVYLNDDFLALEGMQWGELLGCSLSSLMSLFLEKLDPIASKAMQQEVVFGYSSAYLLSLDVGGIDPKLD